MYWQFFYLSVWLGLWSSLPDQDSLRDIDNPIASEVYSIDGKLLGKYFIENRTNVSYDALSPHLVNALIATEDHRFFSHDGVDQLSLGRVVVKSILLQKESAGGGSTISQQLAKNLFPRQDLGFFSLPVNKVREMIIARRLERIYSKEEIIAFYLNTVAFADNAFGIEVAAQRYFNQTAAALQPEEAATLIGMLKAPTYYNPRRHAGRAQERRNLVIAQMRKHNYIDQSTQDTLSSKAITLDYTPLGHHHGLAPYFREMLRGELQTWCSTQKKPNGETLNLYTDGLKIFTTIHSGMQKTAENVVAEHMKGLQKAFDRHWKWGKKSKTVRALVKRDRKRSARYQQLGADSLRKAQIDSIFATNRPMDIFSWNQSIDSLSPNDSILHQLFQLHAGLIAMDPINGHIRAWVGGIDHHHYQLDHVKTHRQAGSIFKPIVYAAALEEGFSPCEYISNEQVTFENYNDWTPRNSDNEYGGEYSMQGALARSVNVVAVNLIMETGPQSVADLGNAMGISTKLPPYPALALGAADVSLLDMSRVYATIANSGLSTQPSFLLRVEDRHNNLLREESGNQSSQQVLQPKTAHLLTEMLRSVIDHGTARAMQTKYGLGKHIAGKTGTSQNQADGWFVGMTPGLVAAAWVGAEDPAIHFRTLAEGQGARTALPLVGGFMQKVFASEEFSYLKELTFPPLDAELKAELDCEEFWFPLKMSEFKEWWQEKTRRDSIEAVLDSLNSL